MPKDDVQTTDTKPQIRIYHTHSNQHQAPLTEPSKEFACTDKIFTVLELNHYPNGKYQLSIQWIDPNDRVRETSRYPFNITKQNKPTKLWTWLSLSRAQGAGILAAFNPAAGLEEFIGKWRSEVRINNTLIGSADFMVLC